MLLKIFLILIITLSIFFPNFENYKNGFLIIETDNNKKNFLTFRIPISKENIKTQATTSKDIRMVRATQPN